MQPFFCVCKNFSLNFFVQLVLILSILFIQYCFILYYYSLSIHVTHYVIFENGTQESQALANSQCLKVAICGIDPAFSGVSVWKIALWMITFIFNLERTMKNKIEKKCSRWERSKKWICYKMKKKWKHILSIQYCCFLKNVIV